MSTPFDEYEQEVHGGLVDLVTNGSGGDAFEEFHGNMRPWWSMMSPSHKMWVRGALNRFRKMHNIPPAQEMTLVQADELFWFGWWCCEKFERGELWIPKRTHD